MATIRKIPRKHGPVYQAIIRRKGTHTSRCFKVRSHAKRWALRKEAAIDSGVAGLTHEAERHTLAQAIVRYRAELLPAKSDGTQMAYDHQLGYWQTELGSRRLSDLSAKVISQATNRLERQNIAGADQPPKYRAPATVNRYLAALGAVLTATVRQWHWLDQSPLPGVAKGPEAPGRTRFLTADELQRLLAACRQSESRDLYLAVLLSLTTGARRGEIMGARWENLDLSRGVLHIRNTKNTDDRMLPLDVEVVELLRERCGGDQVRRISGLIFPSTVSPNKPIELEKAWRTAMRAASVKDFRWHDLRHSAASFLAMAGASLTEIGDLLGHRSAQTTKRYAHLAQGHTHSLMRSTMDKVLRGESDDG